MGIVASDAKIIIQIKIVSWNCYFSPHLYFSKEQDLLSSSLDIFLWKTYNDTMILMKGTNSLKPFLTPEEVRRKMKWKSIWTVYRNIKSGKLKAIIAPKYLIEESELKRFIKRHKIK